MSKVKAGSSSKNNHNNAGARLGVKRSGGQTVNAGEVLVRQTGATKIAGNGLVADGDRRGVRHHRAEVAAPVADVGRGGAGLVARRSRERRALGLARPRSWL